MASLAGTLRIHCFRPCCLLCNSACISVSPRLAVAYTINPIINLLHRRFEIPRWLGTSFTLLIFASAMLTIMSALVTRIVVEIISLSKTLSNNIYWWRDQIEFVMNKPEIQNLIQKLNSFYQENPNYQEPINNRISDTASLVAQTSTNIITYFLNGIVTVITSLPNAATIAVVVLLAAFFIGNDWPRLANGRQPGFQRLL